MPQCADLTVGRFGFETCYSYVLVARCALLA